MSRHITNQTKKILSYILLLTFFVCFFSGMRPAPHIQAAEMATPSRPLPSVIPFPSTLPTQTRPVVLMYHEIADAPENSPYKYLYVSSANFSWQMSFLRWARFTTIFPEEILESDNFQNPIIITFDDGYENNYTVAFPLLKEFNIKATIFVITSLIDTPGYLTTDQIKEMSASGLVRIYPHTHTHVDLTTLTAKQIWEDEIQKSAQIIYDITGVAPRAISYPNGKANWEVLEVAKHFFSVGFGVQQSTKRTTINLNRINVPNNTDEFQKIIYKNYKF